MTTKKGPVCSLCGLKTCSLEPGTGKTPPFCPMENDREFLKAIEKQYFNDTEIKKLAIEAARTESSGYCKKTRIEEIMDFAHRIQADRIGIAHCIGLMHEAKITREIFISGGFEVFTACCKVGSINKEKIGLKDDEKVRPGQYEALCNPIAQAKILEKAGARLNVVLGLCVGHDTLFFAHSKVPVTVLIVKDRVLGHNPVAALYTHHSYYKRLGE